MSDYVTATQLKNTLGITSSDPNITTDIQASVTGASRAIDNLCQRRFYADAADASRYYSPERWDQLEVDDLISLTSLFTRDDGVDVDTNDGGGQTWTVNTDFWLAPMNAASDTDVWPYTRLVVNRAGSYTFNTYYGRSVIVTGKFGWSAVPDPIYDATELLAERLYKMRREAPLGVISMEQAAVRIARADSNLMMSLGPYMRRKATVA